MRFCKVPEKVMKLSKIVRFAGSLQALAQLVQQAEQLGVLLRGEQALHKFVGLVQGLHGLFTDAGSLFGQYQALEPGVLRYALTLDVAFALHELQNVGHSGAGDGELPLDVPLVDVTITILCWRRLPLPRQRPALPRQKRQRHPSRSPRRAPQPQGPRRAALPHTRRKA